MQIIQSILGNLINIIKNAWEIISGFFQTMEVLLDIVISIVNTTKTVIIDFPGWLKAFLIAAVAIEVAQIVVGRDGGKTKGE